MATSITSPLILVVQSLPLQGQLWRLALESQGFKVHQEWPEVDILAAIATHTPKLVVLDMTSGLFNPYAFCREAQARFPEIPVVLTCHEHRQIDPVERRWALQQGAADLMPALSPPEGVEDSLQRVIELAKVEVAFNQAALDAVISKDGVTEPRSEALPEAPTVEAAPQPEEPKAQAKPKLMYRGRPIN